MKRGAALLAAALSAGCAGASAKSPTVTLVNDSNSRITVGYCAAQHCQKPLTKSLDAGGRWTVHNGGTGHTPGSFAITYPNGQHVCGLVPAAALIKNADLTVKASGYNRAEPSC